MMNDEFSEKAKKIIARIIKKGQTREIYIDQSTTMSLDKFYREILVGNMKLKELLFYSPESKELFESNKVDGIGIRYCQSTGFYIFIDLSNDERMLCNRTRPCNGNDDILMILVSTAMQYNFNLRISL